MGRLLFIKEGGAIWSSHLDLMRALMRSFRRAGIDLKHSQGFTPHPEFSILMPLSVGVESQCEIAEFTLAEGCAVPIGAVAERMNPVLPAGLRALESYEGGMKAGKLSWLRTRLTLTYDQGSRIRDQGSGNAPVCSGAQCAPHGAAGDGEKRILRSAQNDRIEALRDLFARPSLIVEKHSKKGTVETDIAPMIREVTVGAVIGRPDAQRSDLSPVTSHQSPGTSDQSPGTSHQSPGTSDQSSGTSHQSPGTSDQSSGDRGSSIVIEAVVAAQNPTLNPLLLVTAIETYLPEYRPDLVQCRRLELYDAEMNVFR